jgi:hypothetical protein
VFLLWFVVFAPLKDRALAFVSESKMLRIPFAHLITTSGFEEDTADSKDALALLHFYRRLRLVFLSISVLLFGSHTRGGISAEESRDSEHQRPKHGQAALMENVLRLTEAALPKEEERNDESAKLKGSPKKK